MADFFTRVPGPLEVMRRLGLNVPSSKQLGKFSTAVPEFVGPQADVAGMVRDAGQVMPNIQAGDYGQALANLGMAAAAIPFMAFPGTVSQIKGATKKVTDELPKTRKEFFKHYQAAHKDLRGSGENKQLIMEKGFQEGAGINALPPYRGGKPLDVIETHYGPKTGDTVYIAPKEGVEKTGGGLKIKKGFKPTQHEVLTIQKDHEDLYDAYLRTFSDIPSPGTVSQVKGVTKKITDDIRPAKENINTVIDANTVGGRVSGDEIVNIKTLSGGPSKSSRGQKAVKEIVEKMKGPEGYIERLIVDQDGNVIEGAHRLEALRRLGVEDVPITRIIDPTANINTASMRDAIEGVGNIRSDHVNQIMAQVGGMLDEVGGDPSKVIAEFELPRGFEKFFHAALKSVVKK